MNILFSPIGNTDPITGNLDGAMLHICRHCNIDKVIMYLSKTICAVHRKDNRYVAMVEKLAQLQGRTIECELIEKENLEEVQIFDFFIEEFDMILSDIEQKYPDDKLFLNVSSGTPAMKSALQVLAYYRTRSYSIIQVTGPGYSVQRTEFNIHTAFENDLDNKPETPSRIHESRHVNFIQKAAKKNIAELIDNYDYSGALTTAHNSGITDEKFLTALEATDLRYKFFIDEAKKRYKDSGKNVTFKNNFEEYMMILGIKIERSEYADFMRAITPLIYELNKMILKEQCGLDVNKYIIHKPYGDVWALDKMDNAKDDEQANKAFDLLQERQDKGKGVIYSSGMHYLIQNLSYNKQLIDLSKKINRIEKERNTAAHYLNGTIDKEYIQANDPLNRLFDACIFANVIYIPDDVSKNEYYKIFFNEYRIINTMLKEMLENC